ncbi:MAG TPA: FAD-dependent 5-carboxymethylaminomethyl-2-thiouridine(34) oxidoreductase MnmC [Aquabacterium sp.]|uniref:FAD-dependent 5-carboxymethylaminomethyl-2-thiouridine(34) oxidoreductase MnmC n=1 Tax=Aquabacterium sp. TaxID=1872578 RepID=UPI002E36BCAC|nr:FAD-dependent 5-carboxymethylaminomethyl-2-thiouridine(34) oxidoreductase MnmC [Aquabacterium sp.]HEX5355004.1 FAD-dependent 5-carboxymethylaminomethyl-2-thiouridine(34) oxidoreductase MnmC [Aquabacterium sp.]
MTVEPATLGEMAEGYAAGVPYSPLYDDLYHAAVGAWAQAQHVFMVGNGLPGRWQGRTRFVILETGFGLGNNFLATWAAWRADAQRCSHLVFISIEKHPLHREDLARVHGLSGDKVVDLGKMSESDRAARLELAQRLTDAWPALTPGMHTLHFDEPADGGVSTSHADKVTSPAPQRVTLLLGLGDIADLLPKLMASVDAFYLDGFAPAKNPQMWDTGLLSRLNRLAAPACTAATWSCARPVRDALTTAGFNVERVEGFAYKPHMLRASYQPRFTPPLQAGGWHPEPARPDDRHAIIMGAGLAGCAAARALCLEGWHVTLIDQHEGPAREGSGNPGGMFHSVLHAEDGIHARAHRAAAMATWRTAQGWIKQGHLDGQVDGLLRLDGKTTAEQALEWLSQQALPADHVQWLDQEQARTLSGLPVESGGWLFHQGGWLHPAGLASLMLESVASLTREGQPLLRTVWGQPVTAIAQTSCGEWQALCDEVVLASAPTLVLCCAMQSGRVLDKLPPELAVPPLPLSAVRGQISRMPLASTEGLLRPHLPVAGSGYVLALPDDHLLCGATTQHHDDDPAVRETDHRHNLRQAARLGACPAWPDTQALPAQLQGRTAWRATTPDRLPLVGALPWSQERLAAAQTNRRLDQVRLVPRQRGERGGLFAMTGLGSRGITWSCLAAELLAHWVTGGPCPVETDLRDALDPARFLVRQMTRPPKAQ